MQYCTYLNVLPISLCFKNVIGGDKKSNLEWLYSSPQLPLAPPSSCVVLIRAKSALTSIISQLICLLWRLMRCDAASVRNKAFASLLTGVHRVSRLVSLCMRERAYVFTPPYEVLPTCSHLTPFVRSRSLNINMGQNLSILIPALQKHFSSFFFLHFLILVQISFFSPSFS